MNNEFMKTIHLTQGMSTNVDDEDYEQLMKRKWKAKRGPRTWYAESIHRGGSILMHRLLLDAWAGQYVDHIDGNGLNNQRSNLRLCSQSQNLANGRLHFDSRSGYKGASFHKRRNKFQGQIRVNGKNKALGFFLTAKEAAKAYDEAAKKYFGEFARLNFPSSGKEQDL